MLIKKTKNRQIKRLDRVKRSPSIYSRTEEQAKVRNFSSIGILLVFVFLGLLSYLVLFSNYLKVVAVKANNLKYYNQEIIDSVVRAHQENILNKNVITYSTNGLKEKIGELSEVKAVSVKKNVAKKEIIVVIEEKRPLFVWETMGKKYLVDENGVITGGFEDKFKELPVIIDTKNVPIEINNQITTPVFAKFIDDLARDFNAYTSVKITKIEVPEITSEIKVTTNSSWYALFDTTRTAKGQLVNLSRIIGEAKAKYRRLQYVDLRIDNRIFYK